MIKRILLFISITTICLAQVHPNIMLSKNEVSIIRRDLNKYPAFVKAFNKIKLQIDKAIALPIEVPIPLDAAGYTHEKHKQNGTNMQQAGVLFQITKDEKYAKFIKELFLLYSKLYPSLQKHPAATSNSYGRLFWQSLNEYVWTVNTTQAYDCIYDYLTVSERKNIEENIFRKLAEFFSVEHAKILDLIHNHGTWSCAAVGMIGMVLNDKDLIEKSLYGTKKNRLGGYLKQLESLFSPDGFYTEGNYYARYALMPFYTYASALNNYMPELKIFDYHNSILKKGLYTALQMTYVNGEFIPINDAAKGKDYLSPEIVSTINIAYTQYGQDESLLNIAKKQKSVMLSEAGLLVAKALSKKNEFPDFNYISAEYSDGAKGDEGGVGILRHGNVDDQSLVLMKYTGHGLSHGHFDKLSMLYYDNGIEVLQDYGFARFVNTEPKNGGRYLPENKSFAMQTIAHNTITVDEKSNFDGKESISEKYHSNKHFFDCGNADFQIMSAKDSNAFKGVKMQRTIALLGDKHFIKPLVIDIFKVTSDIEHQYDLPYYYMGHFLSTNIKYTSHTSEKRILGKANGYQHLWLDGEGSGNEEGVFKFSWMMPKRYYTITSNAGSNTKVLFTRIGGNDPNFNLRNEPAVMLRYNGKSNVFASVIEPHGSFDPVTENSNNSEGIIKSVRVIGSNDEATVIEINAKNNLSWTLMITNKESLHNTKHSVEFSNKKYEWIGNYNLIKTK